jgi:hypothetical protein
MNWPTSQDYNEAIQNAASSFADSALKSGEVVVNAIGLPVPRSGNFADVYQFKDNSGKTWALKCFTRKVAGLQERYAKIDEHIGKANFPFTVGFKYLAEGVRVRGQWFPLLKMEWVEGFTLNEFVRENAAKPQYLNALLQMWAKLCARLRDGNFAHADLQHGNVLLVPGDAQNKLGLKLIDYDGMWVPALAEYHSGEIGHPNFQHPLRLRDRLYNADCDRFPHLVIACALRATVLGGRALWDQFDNGDNLLFKEADLREPENAPVFKALWDMHDKALCVLVGKLALASKEPMRKTPWVDDLLLSEDGEKLTAAEEKKVMDLLGVGPHFTAGAAVAAPAGPASPTIEFSDFATQVDKEDQKSFARRPAPSDKAKRKKEKAQEPKRSLLPYYIGGGVLAIGLIVGLVAMTTGGKPKAAPVDVARGSATDPSSTPPPRLEKKDRAKDVRVVETAPKKDPAESTPETQKPPDVPSKETPKPPDEPITTKPPDAPIKEAPKPPELPADLSLLDLATPRGGVSIQDGFVRLTSQPRTLARVGTKQIYTGDLDITVVARTNHQNIRIAAFAKAEVIFNWELNPSQLRVHRPDASKTGVNVEPLATNTWYTLRFVIAKNNMSVFVDGKRVFEEKGTYDVSGEFPVRVYTQMGSVVDVKSVVVVPATPIKEAPPPVKEGPPPVQWVGAPKRIWRNNFIAKNVVFSDDGAKLLIVAPKSPELIQVHSAADGKLVGAAIRAPGRINTMRAAPGNLVALTTSNDNKLVIFDYKAKQTTFTFDVADRDMACPIAADANVVVVDEPDGSIGVYSLTDGKNVNTFKLTQQPATIKSLACTPDGKTIAVFTQEGFVQFKPANATNFRSIHSWGGAGSRRIALAPDGKLAAYVLGKGAPHAHDLAPTKLRLLSGGNDLVDLVVANDGRHIAAVSVSKGFIIWDIDINKPVFQVPLEGPATALALSPDGQSLAIATEFAASLQLWQFPAAKK